MGQVDGKVAIVTGGASGIGAGCATTLAREGTKVVVTDVDDAGGQAVADKIGSGGGEAIYLHQDVTLEENWPAIDGKVAIVTKWPKPGYRSEGPGRRRKSRTRCCFSPRMRPAT